MAALNELALTKLQTTTGVAIGGNATLYIVPTGKTLIPTSLTIRSATAGMTLAQNVNFGSLPSTFGFATAQSLSGLVTTSYFQMVRISNASVYFTVPAGSNFGMAVISGASASTASFDFFGYLI